MAIPVPPETPAVAEGRAAVEEIPAAEVPYTHRQGALHQPRRRLKQAIRLEILEGRRGIGPCPPPVSSFTKRPTPSSTSTSCPTLRPQINQLDF